MLSKTSRIFNVNIPNRAAGIISFCSVFIALFTVDYNSSMLGYSWLEPYYFVTPWLFAIFILLQIEAIYSHILSQDYFSFYWKIFATFLASVAVQCIIHFPFYYRNYQYVKSRAYASYKLPVHFIRQNGSQLLYFNLNGIRDAVRITNFKAKEMEKGQKSGISYCLYINIKDGLNKTYVIDAFKVETCNHLKHDKQSVS